jgi:hypothetical protein
LAEALLVGLSGVHQINKKEPQLINIFGGDGVAHLHQLAEVLLVPCDQCGQFLHTGKGLDPKLS